MSLVAHHYCWGNLWTSICVCVKDCPAFFNLLLCYLLLIELKVVEGIHDKFFWLKNVGLMLKEIGDFHTHTSLKKKWLFNSFRCGEKESLEAVIKKVLGGKEGNHKGQGLWVSMEILQGDIKQVSSDWWILLTLFLVPLVFLRIFGIMYQIGSFDLFSCGYVFSFSLPMELKYSHHWKEWLRYSHTPKEHCSLTTHFILSSYLGILQATQVLFDVCFSSLILKKLKFISLINC